jgi:cephalosporin-C deacetylase
MPSPLRCCAILLLGSLAMAETSTPPAGFFARDPASKVLSWSRFGYSLRAEPGTGWTSINLGGDEFIRPGGLTYRYGERWATTWPNTDNIAHDNSIGRFGMVADGLTMLRISPDWTRPQFEIYAGANDKAPQELVILLADGVMVKFGPDQDRAWMRQCLRAGDKQTINEQQVLLLHPSGRAMRVQSNRSPGKDEKGQAKSPPKISVGTMPGPDGTPCLALRLPCAGFAANSLDCFPEVQPNPANLASSPQFLVHSSDDPTDSNWGPTNGVRNPIYTRGSKLDCAVTFTWLGREPFTGRLEVESIHAIQGLDWKQSVDIPASRGEIRVPWQPAFSKPGVHDLWARLVAADGTLIWTDRYRCSWEHLAFKPDIVVQPDFDAFWDDTLKQLRSRDLAATTTEHEALKGHPDWEFHDVSYTGWDGRSERALLFVPRKRNGPLPAMVTAHPGTIGWGLNKRPDGLFGSEVKQDPRFVTIVPLVRGYYSPDAKDVPFNNPWWGPLDDRDTYVARAWYCNLVRAVDYLATRPDLVDMKRIVAKGGSQGGGFSLVLGGLEPRISAVFADCPSNCQPHEMLRGNYASFGPTPGQVPAGKTLEQTIALFSYYNPANFCPRIRVPTQVGINIGDLTVHSMGPLAAYHNLTGLKPEQKGFHPGFSHFHGSGPGLGVAFDAWAEVNAGPKPAKPKKEK